MQTSALPLGYGAVSLKLASYLDFLNPPSEVLPTSFNPCRAAPVESRTAETAGLPKPTRSIRPKPRVSVGIFVGTCRQAGALPGSSPQVNPRLARPRRSRPVNITSCSRVAVAWTSRHWTQSSCSLAMRSDTSPCLEDQRIWATSCGSCSSGRNRPLAMACSQVCTRKA